MDVDWGDPDSVSGGSTNTGNDSGLDTKEIMDTLGLLYTWDQDRDSADEQQQTLQQGFDAQNPFNPYRGLFAGEMFNLQQNPGSIVDTPGYSFAYDQGLQSLFAKQAATGNRFSGRAMTEATQFGQGLASQMYNSEMDRLMTLSGASFAPSGGIETAQNLSSSAQQSNFNDMWFYNELVNQVTGNQQQPNQQFTPWNPNQTSGG